MPEILVFGSFLCVIGAGFTLTVLLLARDGWITWRRARAARQLAERPPT
ncbi:MAG: hypothetical protein V4850_08880 [Myxococcota bacterium]